MQNFCILNDFFKKKSPTWRFFPICVHLPLASSLTRSPSQPPLRPLHLHQGDPSPSTFMNVQPPHTPPGVYIRHTNILYHGYPLGGCLGHPTPPVPVAASASAASGAAPSARTPPLPAAASASAASGATGFQPPPCPIPAIPRASATPAFLYPATRSADVSVTPTPPVPAAASASAASGAARSARTPPLPAAASASAASGAAGFQPPPSPHSSHSPVPLP